MKEFPPNPLEPVPIAPRVGVLVTMVETSWEMGTGLGLIRSFPHTPSKVTPELETRGGLRGHTPHRPLFIEEDTKPPKSGLFYLGSYEK